MEELKASNSSKSNKERTSWEKEVKMNGIREGICVRKVSNGYVIRVYKCGYPDDNYDGKYIDEEKEYVSTTNPLATDPEAKEIDLSGDALKEIRNLYFE